MQHDFDPYVLSDLLSPLTFAIVGQSKDLQVIAAPGTGFFIAPYVAITAKHVVYALWEHLSLPWNQDTPPKPGDADFFAKPMQLLDVGRHDVIAIWEITRVIPCPHTDVAVLIVVPSNDVAKRFQWPAGFPELELRPPRVGAEVLTFGYPQSKIANFKPGATHVEFHCTPTAVSGEVIAHYEEGRGSWRFPHFSMSTFIRPGLSGAPVVHNGKICGIVSYGTTTEEGIDDAYAACLWPLLQCETSSALTLELHNTPILDLLRSGRLKAAGWEELKMRIEANGTRVSHPASSAYAVPWHP